MWHLYPNEIPPDIPEDEDFGVVDFDGGRMRDEKLDWIYIGQH